MLAWPDGHDEVFEGAVEGRCVWPMRGDRGHGYDPMFQPDGHDVTFGRWTAGRRTASATAPAPSPAGGGLLCLRPPAEDWRAGGFGVYVHWPFCAAKCPYCDFNSHVRGGVDAGRWRRALVAEIARRGARRCRAASVDTRLLRRRHPEPDAAGDRRRGDRRDRATAGRWPPDAEITLEANPTSVEAGRFRGYRDAGVNRLSMGVQALNDADLRALGRLHDTAEAVARLRGRPRRSSRGSAST